jgi:hypothetical protein
MSGNLWKVLWTRQLTLFEVRKMNRRLHLDVTIDSLIEDHISLKRGSTGRRNACRTSKKTLEIYSNSDRRSICNVCVTI